MLPRIVTARHGRPDVDRSVKITAREYGAWWANYDLTGLAPGQTPPEELVDIAGSSSAVLCSTLPRSIETAAAVVGTERTVPRDAIFVEAPLPPPPLFPSFVKFTPTTWGVISRIVWFLGYAPRGTENHWRARRRATNVAHRLIEETSTSGPVLLCAHGYLNWMVHRVLIKKGWRLSDHQGGNDYWSFRVYEPKDSAARLAKDPAAEPKMAAE